MASLKRLGRLIIKRKCKFGRAKAIAYYNQIVCAELKTSNHNVDDMLPIQFQFAQNVEIKSSDFKLLRMRIQLFTKNK